jgi:hypothetical protein
LEVSVVIPSVLESSSSLLGVLLGSQVFMMMRWTMLETLFGEVASTSLYFVAKPSLLTWGVEVDGLAYPMHLPTVRSCQPRG